MNSSVPLDFTAFFRAESEGLLRMCVAVTLDREHARDVAQETMARAWREWDRLGTPAPVDGPTQPSPAAWCRTVALNLVRSDWRRRRTAQGVVQPDLQPVSLGAADLDLRDALTKLSVRQREAIVLHHLLDLSVTQCADAMGLGESTVKEHLQRGRLHLERHLNPMTTTSEG